MFDALARDIIRGGEIGELGAVNVVFTYFNADPLDIRNRLEIGGGALLDIGATPSSAAASSSRRSRFGFWP